MIFSETSIKNILNWRKQQTRRLVKEGEELRNYDLRGISDGKLIRFVVQSKSHYRFKWQVGKKYAVQAKRGGHQIQYCSICRHFAEPKPNIYKRLQCHACDQEPVMKDLFIEITAIRKEKLLGINYPNAQAEGFNGTDDFFEAFFKLNKRKCPKSFDEKTWNPFVWVISFKVV